MAIEHLIEFVIYIMPGFIAYELYHSFYPVEKRSDFIIIAWSVIYGILIFSLVNWIDIKYLKCSLKVNSKNFPGIKLTILLLLGGVFWGILMGIFHFLRFKIAKMWPKMDFIAPDPQSIWMKVNQPSNEDWAVVYLQDGSIYLGWIDSYRFNPNIENQDFLLTQAKLNE